MSEEPPETPPLLPEPPAPPQPKNPLHGITLEAIVTALEARYGWEGLGERIPVRCFTSEPSLKSCLTFLRKTPWARAKVEDLYLNPDRVSGRGRRGARRPGGRP